MERFFYILYQVMTGNKLGKILLGKTEFEVQRYLPFDAYGLGARTASVFLRHSFKALFVFFIGFFWMARGDTKYFLLSAFAGVAAYYDALISWKRKSEVRLLGQLSLYIGELRHSYYRRGEVSEAFSEAFASAGEELKLHLGIMEEVLESEGVPERYKATLPSRYLLLLLSICQCTIRFGDEDMAFVANLDELQKNIDSDLLKWDRENYSYNSLFWLIVIPLLVLPYIERWAVTQIDGLSGLYSDFRGSLLRLGILFLTFPVFLFFLLTKDTEHRGVNPLMNFILEQPIIHQLFQLLMEFREEKKKKEGILFEEYFPGYSYLHFILMRLSCFLGSLFLFLLWLWHWKQDSYYVLIALILAFGFSYLPYLALVIRLLYYESELEDEIGQVRLIMGSLSVVAGMTAREMLLWVESFTGYLKASISTCIDEFGTDEEQAFYRLREKWKNTGFTLLVDDLIASDKIGIKEAFKDLSSRREYYLARRRQDRELISRKKEALLNTFMYLPFMSSVFLYLILPFMYLGLTSLLETTKNLT